MRKACTYPCPHVFNHISISVHMCMTSRSQAAYGHTCAPQGMLLQVKASRHDRSCFFVSDSRGNISVFDRRMPKHSALGVQNDSPVYALSLSQTGVQAPPSFSCGTCGVTHTRMQAKISF